MADTGCIVSTALLRLLCHFSRIGQSDEREREIKRERERERERGGGMEGDKERETVTDNGRKTR